MYETPQPFCVLLSSILEGGCHASHRQTTNHKPQTTCKHKPPNYKHKPFTNTNHLRYIHKPVTLHPLYVLTNRTSSCIVRESINTHAKNTACKQPQTNVCATYKRAHNDKVLHRLVQTDTTTTIVVLSDAQKTQSRPRHTR